MKALQRGMVEIPLPTISPPDNVDEPASILVETTSFLASSVGVAGNFFFVFLRSFFAKKSSRSGASDMVYWAAVIPNEM